jgi:hypothetical protein
MKAEMEIKDQEMGYVALGTFIGATSVKMIKALIDTKGKKSIREDIKDQTGRKVGSWMITPD